LAVTLPYNRHHFSEMVVITTPQDSETRRVSREGGASIFATDVFYDKGAAFNKWAALELALTKCGRHGWLCLMDADVLWPVVAPMGLTVGKLLTPLRRMAPAALPVPPERDWPTFATHRNVSEHAGYTQVFHGMDPVLGQPPWHQMDWKHAGGADSFFQRKWRDTDKVRPSWECLHLGEAGRNWCGRATPMLDGSELAASAVRRQTMSEMLAKRREVKGFAGERLH